MFAIALLGACDCSGGLGNDGPPCTSSAECPLGSLCIDNHCTSRSDPDCVDPDGDGHGPMCDRGADCDEADPTQTGVEVCDGVDNDCDSVADNGVLSPCGDCDIYCDADGIGVGTSGGGFMPDVDPSEGVSVDPDGALVLDSRSVDTHFIWIANTGQGTVSKVDTRTFVEVGRYVSGPSGAGNDPSRTSVNSFGDVYVGNRGGASVTKISALGPECPDTNGDGAVTTSTGPDDVLAWGMDDCVLWNTPILGGFIRAVAAQDVDGLDFTLVPYVWIGDWNGVRALKLDGTTGAILLSTASPTNTYGFALDGNGQLWISGRNNQALGRIDTTRCVDAATCDAPCAGDPDMCVKQAIPLPGGYEPYGITVDARQRVWTANHGSATVTRYDPTAAVGSRWAVASVGTNCHGIAADGMNWVWAACWDTGVVRLSGEDPTMFTAVAGSGGFSCKGMAVDFDGKIWSINNSHNSAVVITPGPTLTDATVLTGVADRIVSPYTYSDMTGQQLRLATNPRGYYRHVFEGCAEGEITTGTEWGELRWEADVVPGTRLVFRARVAATAAALDAATWVLIGEVPPLTSPAAIGSLLGPTPHGRFIEIEVQLHSDRSSPTEVITPRVFSFGPTHSCPPSLG